MLQPFADIEIIAEAGPPFEISPGETKRILDIPNIDQDEDRPWCYAACAEMVFAYYQKTKDDGTSITQCDVVGKVIGKTHPGAKCCKDPPDTACTQIGCEPDDIVDIYTGFGLHAASKKDLISFKAIQDEINLGRPVEVCIQWSTEEAPELFSAHVVIVRGWINSSTGQFLKILDPLPSDGFGGLVSYQQLIAGFSQGAWKLTFLEFPDKH